ncbi:hypothetical protein ES703_01890 [subsurface metagenome]
MGEYGRVDGQCSTCLFAKEFGFADSPSGPEDGVHCISIEHAKFNDENEGNNRWMRELTELGFMDMWRLEAMAEADYKCPQWLSKEREVYEQRLPAPDEAPLTDCPGCGKEYNIMEEERDDYVKIAPHIFRHTCGQLITFTGG